MTNRYNILIQYVREHECPDILEIGVFQGGTAQLLITNSKAQTVNYTGVDLFEDIDSQTIEYEKALKPDSLASVQKKLSFLKRGGATLLKGNSRDILSKITNKYDLIFIDGGHSYDTLKSDFNNSINLLKPGGIIFIDDYSDEEWMSGVKKFCDELRKQKDLKITIRQDLTDTYRNFKYHIVEVRQKGKHIDLLTSFNKTFANTFFDIYVPNLPPQTDLYVRYVHGDVDKRFGVFYQKMEQVRDHIETTDNLVFFNDIDVVILDNNIFNNLYRIYKERGEPDLLMQWNQVDDGSHESDEKNIGVMLIKPTERTRELYRKYCEAEDDWIIEKYGFDQKYFNHLLRTEFTDLHVEILPLEFYGGQMRGVHPVPNNIQLYHATFEKDFEHKHRILKAYSEKIKQGL